VSDIIGLGRIILEDDNFSVPRCSIDRVAHVKHAYSDGVIRPFFSISPRQEAYSTRGGASSYFFSEGRGQVSSL
jgi:hypothetical protein